MEPVGQRLLLQRAAERRGQRGHMTHVVGDALQPVDVEQQPVVHRVGLVHARQVGGVGGEQVVGVGDDSVGYGLQHRVALGVGEELQTVAGLFGGEE